MKRPARTAQSITRPARFACVLFVLVGLLACLRADAADGPVWPNPAMAAGFFEAGAKRGDAFWKTDHWDYKNPVHACTQIFFNTAYVANGGDKARLQQVRMHYKSIQSAWNEALGCWWQADSYMTQACMALTLSLTLESGAQVLDPDLRQDMEYKLRRLCAFLSRSTTAGTGDDDLRACNQDAIGASALAVSADYFRDVELRGWALRKVSEILNKAEGPFWTEGGTDAGYQGVGEASFALAADLLWEDLTTGQQRKVSELTLRAAVTRGITPESMRSESNFYISQRPIPSRSSSLIDRIPDPVLAENVTRLFEQNKALGNDYWLFDTPTIPFFWGVLRHADKLAALPKEDRPPGWGGTAHLSMFRSELGGPSSDEKTFLASDDGLVGIFGDISRQLPAYAEAKRHVVHQPEQFNPGGLRYVGKNGRVFVWAEGQYSFPRVWMGSTAAENADPARLLSSIRHGYFGSQYTLTQTVMKADHTSKALVTQHFVMLGDVMLLVIDADQAITALPTPRYCLTIPAATAENVAGGMLVWQSGNLIDAADATVQALIPADGGQVNFAAGDMKGYLANEDVRVWKEQNASHAKPSGALSLASIPLTGAGQRWILLCCDGNRDRWTKLQSSVHLTEEPFGRLLRFKDGKHEYVAFMANQFGKSARIETGAGPIEIGNLAANEVQSALIEGNALIGGIFDGSSVQWNGKPVFNCQEPGRACVSVFHGNTGWFVSVDDGPAKVTLQTRGAGVSLATGLPLDRSSFVSSERLWFAN